MQLERLFTTGTHRVEDEAPTLLTPPMEESDSLPLHAPSDWPLEAVDAFNGALCLDFPRKTTLVEENTVPSWLWRRRPDTQEQRAERSVHEVVTRVVGAAVWRGWKEGVWNSEAEASVFYDEACATLLSRRLVFAPSDMARMGLFWATGRDPVPFAISCAPSDTLVLQNETIDRILAHDQPAARGKWIRFCDSTREKPVSSVAFADTITEWGGLPCPSRAPRAQINLLPFVQNDGSVDVAGLRQTAIIAVLLMEFHGAVWDLDKDPARALSLGFSNLSALLMCKALAYDSEKARAAAAALAALISGSALCASSWLAEKMGVCPAFSPARDLVLRRLRNRLRACFGEENDYERLSVTPCTLRIGSGFDLVLISAARRACEEALASTAKRGLRHVQTTSLFTESVFAPLTGAASQGVEAEGSLVLDCALADGSFARRVHPALARGMALLGYDESDHDAVGEYLTGTRTLVGAPGVGRTYLLEKGFDLATLDRIEASLPHISHIRQAFTPWTLGVDFCRTRLGIPEQELKSFRLDILRYLGFSAREIAAANAFCCGHRNVRGALDLAEKDAAVFVTREDLSPEAQIKMAAFVQPFIDGETNLSLSVPAAIVAQARGELILMAWRMGLKTVSLHLDGPLPEPVAARAHLMKRKTASLRTPAALRAVPDKRAASSRSSKIRAAITLRARSKAAGKEKRN